MGGFVGSMFGGPVGALAGYGLGALGGHIVKHYGDQAAAQLAHQLSKGATISEVASMTRQEIGKGVRRALGSNTGETIATGLKKAKEVASPAIETLKTGTIRSVRTAGHLASGAASAASTIGRIETIRRLNPQRFEQIKSDVIEKKNDPTIIATQIMSTGIQDTHPSIARSLIGSAQAANDYLASKLPPEITRPSLSGPKVVPPTVDQLREFSKVLRAVSDPLSILEDLADLNVTPQAIEALRNVYPKLYSEIETEVRVSVAGNEKIPYDKKIAIGIMFGESVDPTLTPEYLQAMRAVSEYGQFEVAPGGKRAGRGGGSAVDSLIKTIEHKPPPKHALRPTPSLASRAQKLSER
jgi:hypothetical protein